MSWKRDFYKVFDRRCIISSETRNASCNSRSFFYRFSPIERKEKKTQIDFRIIVYFCFDRKLL